jgi:hypothetical protein
MDRDDLHGMADGGELEQDLAGVTVVGQGGHASTTT